MNVAVHSSLRRSKIENKYNTWKNNLSNIVHGLLMNISENAVKWSIRGAVLLFVLSPLIFWQHFIDHFFAHLSGSIVNRVVTGEWHIVILNVAAFIAFLIPLSYRRKANWKERGLVVAFFVSLFVEMYGIPLLLTAASTQFSSPTTAPLYTPLVLNFLGIGFALTIPMIYGLVMMTFGMALIAIGWFQLYKGVQNDELVTTGLYRFSRNPQYIGFILIILGWFVGWPTILVSIFAPVLLVVYVRLCIVEEKELSDIPGYNDYKEKVPLLI